jgi:hypothetical protein
MSHNNKKNNKSGGAKQQPGSADNKQSGQPTSDASPKWTPGVTDDSTVDAIWPNADRKTVDPVKIVQALASWVAYIISKFRPEFGSIVDPKKPVATEYPEIEYDFKLVLDPYPERPANFVDPNNPTNEELYAKDEFDSLIKLRQKSRERFLSHQQDIQLSIPPKKRLLYLFLKGQLHPDVIAIMKLSRIGREALASDCIDPLKLSAAIRSLITPNSQSGAEPAFTTAKKQYEGLKQGNSMSLLNYADRTNVARAAFETAARNLNKKPISSATSGALAGTADASFFADEPDEEEEFWNDSKYAVEALPLLIVRFVDGLNPHSSTYTIEAAQTVAKFKSDFNSKDSATKRATRKNCHSIDDTYNELVSLIGHSEQYPLLSSLSQQPKGRFGIYEAKVKPAAVEAFSSSKTRSPTPKRGGGNQASAGTGSGKGKYDPSACSACHKSGHRWAEGVCDEGKRWLAANSSRDAAGAGESKG